MLYSHNNYTRKNPANLYITYLTKTLHLMEKLCDVKIGKLDFVKQKEKHLIDNHFICLVLEVNLFVPRGFEI